MEPVKLSPARFNTINTRRCIAQGPGRQLLDIGVPSGFAVGAFGWMLVENRNS